MTHVAGDALGCPSCKRRVGALEWVGEREARCRFCLEEFELVRFPALVSAPAVAKPQAVLVGDESTCFFHSQNQAEHVCDSCGRFLCGVCSIPAPGGDFCPSCLANSQNKETAIPNRVLYSSAALILAVLPLLIWPFTIVTAPVALWLTIVGWKKPGSLVYGKRAYRFVLAGLIATAQLLGWTYFIYSIVANGA